MAKATVKMKVGLTIRVGPALRALLREVREAVEIRALAVRQAIDKAERWGWDVEPTHLAFVTGTGPTLAFGEEGPVIPQQDDVLMGGLTIRGLALGVIRSLLTESEGKTTLHFGPSGLGLMNYYLGGGPFPEDLELVVTAHGYGGYTRVEVGANGGIFIKESWGEPSWWDGWVVSPEGAVEYVGTVDGPRYRPVWLERALLEDAKAKGV